MGLFTKKPRPFETGQLIVTDGVTEAMENEGFRNFVYSSFLRYCANDWGDLEKIGVKLNRRNLKHGGNLGGQYIDPVHGWEIWILTTANRDRTVVSLPHERKKS